MKTLLIPLATAIAALLSSDPVTAAGEPSRDFPKAVPSSPSTWEELQPGQSLSAMIPESVSSLVLTKSSSGVYMASHRSHRSHASHRSHRSGR